MSKRIIFDFDNTMGVDGCDVDDGLALLYLLGCEDAKIEAICTSYGNNTLDCVQENTLRILDLWGVDIPVLQGSKRKQEMSEASRFIAQKLVQNPFEMHVLATGSTTNIGMACESETSCLSQAASVNLMGGVTESLIINGTFMDELNLSCDSEATYSVIASARNCSIATANNCMPAFFTRQDLQTTFGRDSWFYQSCINWFDTMDDEFAWNGWVCWDVVAAAYLMHPEFFECDTKPVTLYRRFFDVGYLETDNTVAENTTTRGINLPTIKNAQAFKQHVLETWKRGVAYTNIV